MSFESSFLRLAPPAIFRSLSNLSSSCVAGNVRYQFAAALALGAFILWCLKWAEHRIGIPRRASLEVAFATGSPVEQQVYAALSAADYEVAGQSRSLSRHGECCEVRYDLRWRDFGRASDTPDFADELARRDDVDRLEWRQHSAD